MSKQFPNNIVAGDTLKVSISSPVYTSADGYSIEVKITGPSTPGSPIPYSFTTTEENNAFVLTVPAETTAGFGAGLYNYAIVATKALLPSGTEEYTIERGTTNVELRTDLNFDEDLRSHAEKVLDAIEAVIENRASTDQMAYTIAGRTLQRTPLNDLLRLRKYYKDQVAQEQGTIRNKLKIVLR